MTLSPTSAWKTVGMSPPQSGSNTPTCSPRYRRKKGDTRQSILLRMTYVNLALGVVMIVLFVKGPKYPGHQGNLYAKYDAASRRLMSRALQASSFIYQNSCASESVLEANNSIYHSALITGAIIWLLQPVSETHLHTLHCVS